MMTIVVMASRLVVESEQSLEGLNMYIPHMEYNDISHGNDDWIPTAIEIGTYIWTSEDVAIFSFYSQ